MAAQILERSIWSFAAIATVSFAAAVAIGGAKPLDALERSTSPTNALLAAVSGFVFTTGNRRYAR